ncbi:unnamed protein product (macronuclear) [Paramecium tetraurelia]|uniref:CID domain-containing protein n=1 Tax=Paramecium tetraurelia TaxID=5888 RepID=A0DTJ7_PARTE|nr:uncharacterized protein GSPATT00020045001 [Paramecium tetraurelia]CAK86364.1 unnamed protein product [Paramecium tetraurelia]|eukprot:XP_001453761.1 hypothetical protein (macronuclear) [Paramecium tetraurelia strain d4-2]
MINTINIVSLSQLLNNIHLSQSHIDEAARFYIRHSNDQNSQQSLCEEWCNHFHFAKGNVDGDKVIVSLLYMAQRVVESVIRFQGSYTSMSDALKKQMIKAFGLLQDYYWTQELKSQVKDLIKQWDEKQLFTKPEVQSMLETIEPSKTHKEKFKNQFAPSLFLVNFAKNYKELQIRLQQTNEYQQRLDELINCGAQDKMNLYDSLLDQYSKSVENVLKYRKLVIKDILDKLKDLDKTHSKSLIDMKYLVLRIQDLKTRKEKRIQNEYYSE